MPRVGVVGAGGFIGRRLTEVLSQKDIVEVRPLVRTTSSATILNQLGVKAGTADATDLASLKLALTGCNVVVHCAAGSPGFIRKSAEVTYRAADQVGVKRLVYLSTASVHGQAPAPNTDEHSALSDRQFPAYNNAKVQAERILLQLREQGSTEVVMIRPGIVVGPGSSWVAGFVNSLLAGTAYVGNQGKGICNSVYIDNLIEQIYLATTAANVDRQAFLTGDRETVTWADLYEPFANACGFRIEQLPSVDCYNYQPTIKERLRERLRNTKFLGEVASFTLGKLKQAKSAQPPHQPSLNYEMAMLYSCQYKLPYQKAQKMLGYEPTVSFADGCDRTLDWLELKGYSIRR
jgi:nucleoside-diphosphate-sugar epimerase